MCSEDDISLQNIVGHEMNEGEEEILHKGHFTLRYAGVIWLVFSWSPASTNHTYIFNHVLRYDIYDIT